MIAAYPYGSGTFCPVGRGPRSCSGEGVETAWIKTPLLEMLAGWRVQVGKGVEYDGEQFFGCMSGKGWTLELEGR